MSKLSNSLKALINATHAKPDMLPAPPKIRSTFARIADSAKIKNVGIPAWLTISTATTMTMNSPSSLVELYHYTQSLPDAPSGPKTIELMREVGLKCISFNGIPRSINCLGAFKEGLPQDVFSQITPPPSRQLTPENLKDRLEGGWNLWASVYRPFENKLYDKLAASHPNLPVHILNAHYGTLLGNPPTPETSVNVGRVLTSLVAIACLRSQTGVGPQVVSHCFGLRKAFADGTAEKDVEGAEWLATDEGNQWILQTIDELVQGLSGGAGTTFAPGYASDHLKAKL
ncbi:hypothetical protein B0A52_02200 [Exophiala mesophila]|uniref:Dol-P-Man:Man(5)GlcNAc(2)-PP-Dol alpha-1,3-mannosyltransferase n=1 Tax=Exophiala mesophila TaxID=212818 RepID=A0A438NBC2_EXOME|nr:hypothetical protein B0A52_02200 [Exophiala mesophila]